MFIFLSLAKKLSQLPISKVTLPTSKVSDIPGLISTIIEWLLGFAGALAVIAIVYSGIMYITAGGDPAKAETAKKNLIWAILGVVIIALALVIVSSVSNILSGKVI